jgi:glutamate N-acetyltransferase / amino-acid N-acetyltransferase
MKAQNTKTPRWILPAGFRSAGIAAGIKSSGRKDLALIVSDRPSVLAGLFTTNRVKAAPVLLDMERVAGGSARAIVANSGNANACTGLRGLRDAKRMASAAARVLGMNAGQVCICSTGPIGLPMPMDRIEAGIAAAAKALSPRGGPAAAEAIMTTDTASKTCSATLIVDGRPVRISGMAKGAGMIQPHMATMLCFLVTDAVVGRAALQRCLSDAAVASFNRITVDGDQSTNDTVLFLANGAAGHRPLRPGHKAWRAFSDAVHRVTLDLALRIARDGEGATKLVEVTVKGARNDREADAAARAVANSFLVKTCWHGDYPNWGRIMAAVGYSGARIVEDRITIWFDRLPVVRRGLSAGTPVSRLSAVQRKERFTVTIDLKTGRGRATVYTCDCSEEYVRINVDYVQRIAGRGPT